MLELNGVMLIVDDATLVVAVGKLSVDNRERETRQGQSIVQREQAPQRDVSVRGQPIKHN